MEYKPFASVIDVVKVLPLTLSPEIIIVPTEGNVIVSLRDEVTSSTTLLTSVYLTLTLIYYQHHYELLYMCYL